MLDDIATSVPDVNAIKANLRSTRANKQPMTDITNQNIGVNVNPELSLDDIPAILARSRDIQAKVMASRKNPTNITTEQPSIQTNAKRIRANFTARGSSPTTVHVDSQVHHATRSQNKSDKVTTDDDAYAVQHNSINTRSNDEVTSTELNKNSSPSDTSVDVTGNLGKSGSKKRTRGPTCVPKTWGQNYKDNISFNGLGQPNDPDKASKLAHFLGAIARNGGLCPLHITDWRLMPKKNKDDMLEEVKKRFDLPAGSDHFILHSINKKWKNWKCAVKQANFNPEKSIQEQLVEKPERVNAQQYAKLVDHWSTSASKNLSEKNKESRAKLEILHRMGKRSYAVVSEIMKDHMGRYPTRAELFEKCCSPPDGSPMCQAVQEAIEKMKDLANLNDEDSSVNDIVHHPNDEFAQVMGRDKDGRLRMFGMGVQPADIYGGKPTRAALERKCMQDNEEMRALKDKLEELTALVHNRSGSIGHLDAENPSFSPPNNHGSSRTINNQPTVKVGSLVELKSLADITETVAIGYVKAIGGVIFNGRDLGPGICEILVQTRVKDEEMLIYPYEHIETIEQAIGAPIAWPLSLVVLVKD